MNIEEFIQLFDDSIYSFGKTTCNEKELIPILNTLVKPMKEIYSSYKDERFKTVWNDIRNVFISASKNKQFNRELINKIHYDIFLITDYKSPLLTSIENFLLTKEKLKSEVKK